MDFNPRSPCGERLLVALSGALSLPFQSTLPVWGATGSCGRISICPCNFNPRSPCGERRQSSGGLPSQLDFNPRSPCGERPRRGNRPAALFIFQSTLPVWGATQLPRRVFCDVGRISIHAPRVGSDPPRPLQCPFHAYFNPRSPCGERLSGSCPTRPFYKISIHAPRVGSDQLRSPCPKAGQISIHAPRVGSDRANARAFLFLRISIHAPRVGSDLARELRAKSEAISIHAPRVGSDEGNGRKHLTKAEFQSTLPVWGATSNTLYL